MFKFISFIIFLGFLASCSKVGVNTNKHTYSIENFNYSIKVNHKLFPFFEPLSLFQINELTSQVSKQNYNLNLLSANQILNLLGEPIIIKSTKNLEIWQYRGKCILNIVWSYKEYSSLDTNYKENTHILWIEALDPNNRAITPNSCFLILLNNLNKK